MSTYSARRLGGAFVALLFASLLWAGCGRSPLSPQTLTPAHGDSGLAWLAASSLVDRHGSTFRLATPTAGAFTLDSNLAVIDFEGYPGPDGRSMTEDDVPIPDRDRWDYSSSHFINDDYAVLGVHFEQAGMFEGTGGGGFEPDGSPGQEGLLLINVPYNFYETQIGPMTLRFDRPQTRVFLDLWAQNFGLGTAIPITLRDAQGNLVRQFQLTNADAILGGEFSFLGGRFPVESATPFTSLELGLTPEGWGWFMDNLMFRPQYQVRHITMDADDVVPVALGTSVRVAVLSNSFLDVTTIVPSSLALGPGAAPAIRTRLQDVDRDGDRDLVAVFDVTAAGIACGSTSVYLTARTVSGERLYARDGIRTRCGPTATVANSSSGEAR